jgi:acetyl-CoA synthetase
VSNETLANLLHEDRSFPPDPAFTAQANGTAELYAAAEADTRGSGPIRPPYVTWSKDFTQVLDWSNAPFAKWFADGELNAAYNCVDRHVEAGRGDKVALHWVGEPGDTRDVTYADLHREVQKAANALIDLGLTKGDTVAIYLPMIPEAVVAMLACARIGAPHSVVFGGFSAEALNTRIADAQAKVVITSDGGYRRGARAPSSRPSTPPWTTPTPPCRTSSSCAAPARTPPGTTAATSGGTTRWPAAPDTHEAQPMEAEHPLFILYTSGTTGKPKGIFHTTGGYLTQAAYTNAVVHDLHPDTDVYWCTADIGWVTGHSYIVYGPLANGATQVHLRRHAGHPAPGPFWEIVQNYKVSILYTAPTAIRTFMKWGARTSPRSSTCPLRVLGSVGEPINPEAWMWYRDHIGGGHCPDRRHLVADRDRRHHDQPAAGRDRPQARLGACVPSPASAPRSSTTWASRSPGRARRLPRAHQAVAGDAPRHLGRPAALRRHLLVALRRSTTSPATAPRRTRRATSGCSAGSTTS